MLARALAGMCVALCVGACGQFNERQGRTHLQFDAEHVLVLNGVIEQGRAIVSSPDRARAREEILQQLFYAAGQLNGVGGAVDLQRIGLEIMSFSQRSDERFEVVYRATMFVAWPRERKVPATFTLIVPRGGDIRTRKAFVAAYARSGSACLDAEADDVGLTSHWYHYRPQRAGCELGRIRVGDLALRLSMRLSVSARNTQGKFPEYAKVWEDRRLIVTAVFGQDDAASVSDDEPGVVAFREFHAALLAAFGAPRTSTLPRRRRPGRAHPSLRANFQLPSGELIVHLELVKNMRKVDEAFKQRFADAVSTSDLVIYSGHAELGANIAAFAKLERSLPGQYQIYFIDSCDSFAYADDTLRDAHQAANPGAGPYKYFDLITNAMPALFISAVPTAMTLVRALVEQRKTYRQILAEIAPDQRAIVRGEEDNRWPAAF